MLDAGDEVARMAAVPLAAPVLKDLLDKLIVLLQQQLGLLQTDQLRVAG